MCIRDRACGADGHEGEPDRVPVADPLKVGEEQRRDDDRDHRDAARVVEQVRLEETALRRVGAPEVGEEFYEEYQLYEQRRGVVPVQQFKGVVLSLIHI